MAMPAAAQRAVARRMTNLLYENISPTPRRVVCRGDVHLLRWDEHVNGAAKTRRLQVEAAIVHAYVTRMSEMQGATSYCVLRADRVRQLLPRQHGPVARCGAGWRG